ncbi:hypothetical protein DFH09DRAFT_1296318 [Mycena vulgaris]|nr:hypothetical protein DFH09DRAFT_1296318 [Mycena vulgaris]
MTASCCFASSALPWTAAATCLVPRLNSPTLTSLLRFTDPGHVDFATSRISYGRSEQGPFHHNLRPLHGGARTLALDTVTQLFDIPRLFELFHGFNIERERALRRPRGECIVERPPPAPAFTVLKLLRLNLPTKHLNKLANPAWHYILKFIITGCRQQEEFCRTK